jgi:histidine triad (HIT) family protein
MCLFCEIAAGRISAHIVHSDDQTLAFLDHRPLFEGHCLLVPREHIETLADLPDNLIAPFFGSARLLAGVIERAMDAQGTFVAMNNRISQSVPHLHAHVVPRRKRDGLKGFFWPRTRYSSDDRMAEVAATIRSALKESSGT